MIVYCYFELLTTHSRSVKRIDYGLSDYYAGGLPKFCRALCQFRVYRRGGRR